MTTRRDFIQQIAASGMAGLGLWAGGWAAQAAVTTGGMRFGLVTYLWGKDMDLPTLLNVCEQAEIAGLELRTEHGHGVEPSLSKAERDEVRKRFADSPVTLVGYGSNAEFHSPRSEELKKNIELTKQYVRLMHDCGGSGVKVKPNRLPEGVPHQRTIEQIGKALNEVGAYAEGFGQEIRVEAHGRGTSALPVMKAVFAVADHRNVGVCWNCNAVDREGGGLEHNFNLVKDRLASTLHVRELNSDEYPYQQLMRLLVAAGYDGWVLLEGRMPPKDKVKGLIEQRELFEEHSGSA